MIGLAGRARVLLFAEPTDMRKGHPGLYGLVVAGEADHSFGARLKPGEVERFVAQLVAASKQ